MTEPMFVTFVVSVFIAGAGVLALVFKRNQKKT
jgi:hypothetical protein